MAVEESYRNQVEDKIIRDKKVSKLKDQDI